LNQGDVWVTGRRLCTGLSPGMGDSGSQRDFALETERRHAFTKNFARHPHCCNFRSAFTRSESSCDVLKSAGLSNTMRPSVKCIRAAWESIKIRYSSAERRREVGDACVRRYSAVRVLCAARVRHGRARGSAGLFNTQRIHAGNQVI